MTKKKRKIPVMHRINPDKSNRMIIAVAIGFGLIVLALFLYYASTGKDGPPQTVAEDVLHYLKSTSGIGTVNIMMDQNRVEIGYDRTSKNDFPRITRFAALKLSNRLPQLSIDFILRLEGKGTEVYRCQVRDGSIQSESQTALPPADPVPEQER